MLRHAALRVRASGQALRAGHNVLKQRGEGRALAIAAASSTGKLGTWDASFTATKPIQARGLAAEALSVEEDGPKQSSMNLNDRESHQETPTYHQFSVQALMEARVHMGHRKRLWNPAMAPYILGVRNGMHIIDLDKTLLYLRRALLAASSMAENGCTFLWLGPGEPQKHELITSIARKAGAYSLGGRWIGGTLTNAIESGQAKKLDYRVPDCLFVIDVLRHAPALKEAQCVGIPVIGIADSDCDPRLLTYPIPGNDDGIYAINMYCHLMKLAIEDGRKRAALKEARGYRRREELPSS